MRFSELAIGDNFILQNSEPAVVYTKCTEHRYNFLDFGSAGAGYFISDCYVMLEVMFGRVPVGQRFYYNGDWYIKMNCGHADFCGRTGIHIGFGRATTIYISEWATDDTSDHVPDVVRYYCENDVISTNEFLARVDTYMGSGAPVAKNVIFSNPATIVIWADGTKTVVKCSPNDKYDKEKGLALCYMKKVFGNNNSFHKIFRNYCKN